MVDIRLAVVVIAALIGAGCAAPDATPRAVSSPVAVVEVADPDDHGSRPAPAPSARRAVGFEPVSESEPESEREVAGVPDCRCEIWLADVLVEDAPADEEGVPIGPVVAVFGDSITGAVGVPGTSWVDLLQQRRPDLEVQQRAIMGMTILRAPSNNMVDHLSEGGAGRALLDGVNTVIYMAGVNDLNTVDAEVDVAVDGFRQIRSLLETAPVDHFLLLPMLPVGEAWSQRTDVGPGSLIGTRIAEFNHRIVAEGLATPFDPGFDLNGDGFGEPEIYAGFANPEPRYADTGGVDSVHPGPYGHEVLAAQVDELLWRAATVGVANIGVGAGSTSSD